jgi:ribosomal protein S6
MSLTSREAGAKKLFSLFLLVPFDLPERDQTFPNREDVREERKRMRHYETIYIVNPNLGEEEYREVIKRYNTLIEKNKGVVIKTEEWGVQRLAYDLKKSSPLRLQRLRLKKKRNKPRKRRREMLDKRGRKMAYHRRKVCRFCADSHAVIDYKDPKM